MVDIEQAKKNAKDFNDNRDLVRKATLESKHETIESIFDRNIIKDSNRGFYTTVISHYELLDVFKGKDIPASDVLDYILNNVVTEYRENGYTISYVNGDCNDLIISWKR